MSAIYLYSSDTPEKEDNKREFTNLGDGLFQYQEVAGTNATAKSIVSDVTANFQDGIKFYLRIKIVGTNINQTIDKVFFVRDPTDIILFTPAKVQYIAPYPIITSDFTVSVDIGSNTKDESGIKRYGGIDTVEIFDTPSAEDSNYVLSVSETDVENLTEITLKNRDNGNSISGFIPPPGSPDFSRYYHYVTLRLRAKKGSATYRDIDVIFFAAGNCGIYNSSSNYGYGSSGTSTVVPPSEPSVLNLLIPTINQPTAICNSSTDITTDLDVNQYAQKLEILVYDAATEGNLLATGEATATERNKINILRSSFDSLGNAIAGFFALQEYGPDRLCSNRIETYIPQCLSPNDGYTITDISLNSVTGLVEVSTTLASDVFSNTKAYTIKEYDSKYGGSLTNSYDATIIDNHTLSFNSGGDTSGFFTIIEDLLYEITSPRFFADIVTDTNFWRWNIASETWEMLNSSNIPPNRELHSMIAINGKIYIRQGKDDNGNILSDTWEYDPAGDAWTQLNDTPTTSASPPEYSKMEALDPTGANNSYIYGGLNSLSGELNNNQKYTPQNTYLSRNNGPVSLYNSMWFPIFSTTYIIGGNIKNLLSGVPPDSSLQAILYETSTNTWGSVSQEADNPLVSVDFATVIYDKPNNKCWVIGGYDWNSGYSSSDELQQVFMYDPLSSSFNPIKGTIEYVFLKTNAPVTLVSSGGSSKEDGELLIFGGKSNGVIINSTYTINVSTGAWTVKSPISSPPARYNHRLIKLGGYIYMFGGKKS